MSTTLHIVDGQIDIDPSTGQINEVTGNRKCGQDLGESLLQDYDPTTDYGSYLRAVTTTPIPFSGDLFIRFYIDDAIQRLIAKQQEDQYLTAAEQITDITELQTSDDGAGTTVFFVSVSTADGGSSEVGAIQATQLNQQFERF
jgi:hypothetical protein